MAVQARLVVVGGDVKTSEINLRLPCTIGRGRGSTIVLAHPLVSRQHCEIYEAEGALMVRDLGSLNGTFINNHRISETAALPPNELLTIGTVTFRAVYEPPSAPGRHATLRRPSAPVHRRPPRPSGFRSRHDPLYNRRQLWPAAPLAIGWDVRNYDLEFLKRFSLVIGFLGLVTVGLILLAAYLHRQLPPEISPTT